MHSQTHTHTLALCVCTSWNYVTLQGGRKMYRHGLCAATAATFWVSLSKYDKCCSTIQMVMGFFCSLFPFIFHKFSADKVHLKFNVPCMCVCVLKCVSFVSCISHGFFVVILRVFYKWTNNLNKSLVDFLFRCLRCARVRVISKPWMSFWIDFFHSCVCLFSPLSVSICFRNNSFCQVFFKIYRRKKYCFCFISCHSSTSLKAEVGSDMHTHEKKKPPSQMTQRQMIWEAERRNQNQPRRESQNRNINEHDPVIEGEKTRECSNVQRSRKCNFRFSRVHLHRFTSVYISLSIIVCFANKWFASDIVCDYIHFIRI